jgi:F-type H+-transporting ATPase subunit b
MSIAKRFALITILALGASIGVGSAARAQEAPAADQPAGVQMGTDIAEEPVKEAAHEHGDPTRGFNFTDLHYTGSPLGGPKAESHGGGEAEGVPAPFLYLVGNFLLLLAILAWKAGPAARKAAEKRHEEIKKALDEAARLREQAKAKLDEYDRKLAAAEKEIAAMVEGMRADAEADKKRIVAAAEAQAAALKKDADERIKAEILRARTMLSREVANAAATAAENLMREKATAQDQNSLVETFIGDVAKSKPTQGRV